jgi:hypothetical protein
LRDLKSVSGVIAVDVTGLAEVELPALEEAGAVVIGGDGASTTRIALPLLTVAGALYLDANAAVGLQELDLSRLARLDDDRTAAVPCSFSSCAGWLQLFLGPQLETLALPALTEANVVVLALPDGSLLQEITLPALATGAVGVEPVGPAVIVTGEDNLDGFQNKTRLFLEAVSGSGSFGEGDPDLVDGPAPPAGRSALARISLPALRSGHVGAVGLSSLTELDISAVDNAGPGLILLADLPTLRAVSVPLLSAREGGGGNVVLEDLPVLENIGFRSVGVAASGVSLVRVGQAGTSLGAVEIPGLLADAVFEDVGATALRFAVPVFDRSLEHLRIRNVEGLTELTITSEDASGGTPVSIQTELTLDALPALVTISLPRMRIDRFEMPITLKGIPSVDACFARDIAQAHCVNPGADTDKVVDIDVRCAGKPYVVRADNDLAPASCVAAYALPGLCGLDVDVADACDGVCIGEQTAVCVAPCQQSDDCEGDQAQLCASAAAMSDPPEPDPPEALSVCLFRERVAGNASQACLHIDAVLATFVPDAGESAQKACPHGNYCSTQVDCSNDADCSNGQSCDVLRGSCNTAPGEPGRCIAHEGEGEGDCGNGVIDIMESCDTGGVPDVGCDPFCNERPGFVCVGEPSNCGPDRDSDGVADEIDNCPDNPNPGQEDRDGDGIGDICDPCGNGVIDVGEDCDSGGDIPGCVNCRQEPGFSCSGEPSDCLPN